MKRRLIALLSGIVASSVGGHAQSTGTQGTGAQAPDALDLSVLDRLQVFGDLRLRGERDMQRPGKPDRSRMRLRLRFGASFAVSDELQVGARLRTGDPDDPNSPHVTLGNAFDSLEIHLDRAFVTYLPDWSRGSSVTAGKFNHTLRRNPVYGELVWDADVQPEGVLCSHTFASSPEQTLDNVRVTGGVYSLIEQSGGGESLAGVVELGGDIRLAETTTCSTSLAYYHYGDTSPDGHPGLVADNAGNAVADTNGDGKPDSFVSDFGLIHWIVSVSYTGLAEPLTLGGELIHNARAAISADTGWSLGIAYGSVEKPEDFMGYYQWQVVQRDAVFTPVAQDDFLLTTNHRSHVLGLHYQVRSDVGVHVWALVSRPETGGPADAQWRLRLDVNIKF